VIKAKSEPAKIVPTAQNAETPTTKIYDRVVDRGQNDKLVPREEAPIDMKDVVGTTSPRVIPQPTAPAAAPSGAQQQHALAVGEPKKVKTIAIRPDMSIAPTSAATAPRNVAAPAESSGPAAPPAAIPPRVIPMPSAAPVAPVQTAAATPTTTATELGGYLVQVSSQRSESDAQISFRALQAKYPNLLGGWQPIIRRADLGDKGVFYRAQIGPFATAEQAQDVCGSLKAAGGQCIVHKN
jgi:hypothetical protein